jgi:hypothetical protein
MITKLKIKMGNKETEMTMSEAQNLYKDLHTLFGEKEVIVYRDNYWHWHYPRPYWGDNQIYCSSSDAATHETLTLNCSSGDEFKKYING